MFRHSKNNERTSPSSSSGSVSPLRRWCRKQHRRSLSAPDAEEVVTQPTSCLMPELTEEPLPMSPPVIKLKMKSKSSATNSNSVSPLRLFRRKQHRHRRSISEPNSALFAARAACPQHYDCEQDDTTLQHFHRSDLQVGRLLGAGGFACVFDVKVMTTSTSTSSFKNKNETKLALKQLRQELLQDKELFGRAAKALVNEAAIMGQLRGHKNILQLRGVSGDADQPLPNKRGFDAFFLVTNALKETMADRLTKWSSSKSTTPAHHQQQRWMYQLNYALQIAQALAFCHEQRIIYRDCKCDNIGFQDEHTIQLFDFGLARALPEDDDSDDDCQTVTSSLDSRYGDDDVYRMTICGTQRWMAPEVYNRGWYSTKADVYSWSMTTVELLTGKKPHSYMSLPVHKILVLEGGGRPSIGEFPVGLQLILQQAWAQNVADRWSMAQVCAALEAYIGSECSQQPPASSSTNALKDCHSKEKVRTLSLQDQAQTNNLADVQQQRTDTKNRFFASAA